jgi:dihydroorotase
LLQKSKDHIVSIHPIGAATRSTDGKDLADMYDMQQAGAVAFGDGLRPMPNAGMTERALLYIKAFNGLLISHPEDRSMSKNGLMNEGEISTRLGLSGMPAIAEEMAVAREIAVLEYTGSRLHLNDISTKGSVALIRAAKKKGLAITATVNAHNLLLTDNEVGQYDTHYKVNPPLRTKADIAALIKGIEDGTIDTVSSQHQPQDEESKKLEFDKADFGMIGLETCYAVANMAMSGNKDVAKIVATLSSNARHIIGLPMTGLAEGEMADLTIFDPSMKWTMKTSDIKSRSRNTPFVGTELTGKVIGIIHQEKISLNHERI